jgi:cysteine desulfurase
MGEGQERNFRAGTENVYGIVGLAKAFELANDNLKEDIKKVSHLKSYFKEKITASIPDISYNGPN